MEATNNNNIIKCKQLPTPFLTEKKEGFKLKKPSVKGGEAWIFSGKYIGLFSILLDSALYHRCSLFSNHVR